MRRPGSVSGRRGGSAAQALSAHVSNVYDPYSNCSCDLQCHSAPSLEVHLPQMVEVEVAFFGCRHMDCGLTRPAVELPFVNAVALEPRNAGRVPD